MPLQYDPDAAVASLSRADRPLARLIERVGPFALSLREGLSPFQALLRAIVYQQLSGHAAGSIYARIIALFDQGRPPTARQILDMPDQRLRAAGLSQAKVAAVNDLAVKSMAGLVPSLAALEKMDDEQIIARLTQVRGVGRWTAEMLLIFRLGRPDVLPLNDLGVRRGFKVTYRLDVLPRPAELARHGRRWAPYRSVASWYLWRAAEMRGALP